MAELPTPSGAWLQALFLVETGVDRTSLRAAFASRLGLSAGETETDIRFVNPRELVTVRNRTFVESQLSPFEYSTLGRDVLDQFTVILDRTRNLVALLTHDHAYTIADA